MWERGGPQKRLQADHVDDHEAHGLARVYMYLCMGEYAPKWQHTKMWTHYFRLLSNIWRLGDTCLGWVEVQPGYSCTGQPKFC